MTPVTRYLDTLSRSLRARQRGEDALEDELLQSLDRLWLEMSEREIQEVNRIVKKFVKGDVNLSYLEQKLKKNKRESRLKLIKVTHQFNPSFHMTPATMTKQRLELVKQEVRIKRKTLITL